MTNVNHPSDDRQHWATEQLRQLAQLATHTVNGISARRIQELNEHTARLTAVAGRLAADPAGRDVLRRAAGDTQSPAMFRFLGRPEPGDHRPRVLPRAVWGVTCHGRRQDPALFAGRSSRVHGSVEARQSQSGPSRVNERSDGSAVNRPAASIGRRARRGERNASSRRTGSADTPRTGDSRRRPQSPRRQRDAV
jgi:hypothetical protein